MWSFDLSLVIGCVDAWKKLVKVLSRSPPSTVSTLQDKLVLGRLVGHHRTIIHEYFLFSLFIQSSSDLSEGHHLVADTRQCQTARSKFSTHSKWFDKLDKLDKLHFNCDIAVEAKHFHFHEHQCFLLWSVK